MSVCAASPGLSVNPSYVTREVTFASCPAVSATSTSTLEYTKNVPRYQGDSVLGVYGAPYEQFVKGNPACATCGPCEKNTVTPLFYRGVVNNVHPTYALAYRGQDQYYRRPY